MTLGAGDVEETPRLLRRVWTGNRSSLSADDTIRLLHGGAVALDLVGRDDLAAEAAVDFAADGYAPVSGEPRTAGSGRRGARDPERAGRTITKPAAETDWHGYPGSAKVGGTAECRAYRPSRHTSSTWRDGFELVATYSVLIVVACPSLLPPGSRCYGRGGFFTTCQGVCRGYEPRGGPVEVGCADRCGHVGQVVCEDAPSSPLTRGQAASGRGLADVPLCRRWGGSRATASTLIGVAGGCVGPFLVLDLACDGAPLRSPLCRSPPPRRRRLAECVDLVGRQ